MYSFPHFEPFHHSLFNSNCCFLTYIQVSQETGKVVCYSHLFKNFPPFVVIHTIKAFRIVSEADIFLQLPCLLHDPTNVGNLISDCCAFFKPCLCIWKLSVHVLLKASLKDFEHNLTSISSEHNFMVVGAFLRIALLWD